MASAGVVSFKFVVDFWQGYPASLQTVGADQWGLGGTSCRSLEFPAGFQYKRYPRPAPAAPVLHKNTPESSLAVIGAPVPGLSSGAGFTFISLRMLYHAFGISSSVR